jgi:hypothetical protein
MKYVYIFLVIGLFVGCNLKAKSTLSNNYVDTISIVCPLWGTDMSIETLSPFDTLSLSLTNSWLSLTEDSLIYKNLYSTTPFDGVSGEDVRIFCATEKPFGKEYVLFSYFIQDSIIYRFDSFIVNVNLEGKYIDGIKVHYEKSFDIELPNPPSPVYQDSLISFIPKEFLNVDKVVNSYIIDEIIYRVEMFIYYGSDPRPLDIHFFCEQFSISNTGKINKERNQYFLGRNDLTLIKSFNIDTIACDLIKASIVK